MVLKYTKILHCKTLQNLPKIGIFGLKTNHLATLLSRTKMALASITHVKNAMRVSEDLRRVSR
jgi:hypothetical protein